VTRGHGAAGGVTAYMYRESCYGNPASLHDHRAGGEVSRALGETALTRAVSSGREAPREPEGTPLDAVKGPAARIAEGGCPPIDDETGSRG